MLEITSEFTPKKSSKPILIEDVTTVSSRGMLSKAWYQVDNKLCLAKGNSLEYQDAGWEPYSEVMAYEIGKFLGFDCIPYWLGSAEDFPEVKTYQIPHVSLCENYFKETEDCLKFYAYIESGNIKYSKDTSWETFVKGKSFEKNLQEMLLFDALIGNTDRHLNNIDFIISGDGTLRLGPIYDCGAALLAWVPTSELRAKRERYMYDKSKPFRTTHKVQLRLINKEIIHYYFNNANIDDILGCIEPIMRLLPDQRRISIKIYLSWRLKMIKELLL